MAEKPEGGGTPSAAALELNKGFRWLAALLGVAALFFGALGVFVVERDWGPIALLVVGTLLTVVGMTGRIPSVKWKDSEVNWPQVAAASKALEEIVESGSAEEQEAVLTHLSSIAPWVSAPALNAIRFDARIVEALKQALPKGVTLESDVLVGRWRTDAMLSNPAGLKVAVEVRARADLPDGLLRAVQRAKELDPHIVSGLLLVRGEPETTSKAAFEGAGWRVLNASDLEVARLRNEIANLFKNAAD